MVALNFGRFLLVSFFLCCSLLQAVLSSSEVGFISSYKLSSGLQDYSRNRVNGERIGVTELSKVAQESLTRCISYSYVFVNQPGITKRDFIDNAHLFPSLQKYLDMSSSIAKFENIDYTPVSESEFLDDLITTTRTTCNIDFSDIIYVEGNNTETFKPYYDTNRKIIKIEFPQLPLDNSGNITRNKALKDYDLFLNHILAKLPTPEFTLVYTSSRGSTHEVSDLEDQGDENGNNPGTPQMDSVGIFDYIFDIPSRTKEYERNSRQAQLPKPKFKKYEPLMKDQIAKTEIYPTVFDKEFLLQHRDILTQILASLIVSLSLYYFISPFSPPSTVTKYKHSAKTNKTTNKMETAKTTQPSKESDLKTAKN